jgi:4-hydroxy-tetrahydrodipicolinate synthase
MFKGSLVALVTPMNHPAGGVAWKAFYRLVEWHIAQGSDGLVIAGTTGESATLNTDEHCQVIGAAVQAADGRVPVIAGTGSNSTREAIALSQRALELGAAACLSVVPYYNKPPQEGLYQHFRAIAEAVDIPQILYNVPGRTICDLLPETVARLALVPRIVGIKEATGKLDRLAAIRASCPAEFACYSGDDATGCEFMLQGGQGVISVTANVAPAAMQQLCKAALAGDAVAARAIDARLTGLHRDLFVEANPIPVKWALAQMGLIPPGIRLPLIPLAAQYHSLVETALAQAGITPSLR